MSERDPLLSSGNEGSRSGKTKHTALDLPNSQVKYYFNENVGWMERRRRRKLLQAYNARLSELRATNDMRVMYRECKLVHGDLSEYNMLMLDERCYIIDVSQSVEHDHPHSLDFLRIDCSNVTRFFRELAVPVLSMRRLFEFIVDPLLTDDMIDSIVGERSVGAGGDDAVFMTAFIPHKLDHVLHFHRDSAKQKAGEEINNPFQNIVSKVVMGSAAAAEEEEDDEDAESVDSEEERERRWAEKAAAEEEKKELAEQRRTIHTRDPEEDKEAKKTRKAAVKEDKRAGREQKTPKHVKKRKQQANKR